LHTQLPVVTLGLHLLGSLRLLLLPLEAVAAVSLDVLSVPLAVALVTKIIYPLVVGHIL
jgi:hypothetical protein